MVDLIDRVGCELGAPQMGRGLDGRFPTEDPAGHALEHDDPVAFEGDVVGVVRVPVDGADPHADDHEHREHVQQHASEAAQAGPPPRRRPLDGYVGRRDRDGCARCRGRGQGYRIGWGRRRCFEHVDDEDGDVVLTARLVGRVDETIGRDPRIGVELGNTEHVVVAHHGGQTVGADQQAVTRPRVDRVEIDVDVGVDPERSGDDRASRVYLGFCGREPAFTHELLDQAVVFGELLEHAVADAVRPRVADVADQERRLAKYRDRR